jgi:hypothetical protein
MGLWTSWLQPLQATELSKLPHRSRHARNYERGVYAALQSSNIEDEKEPQRTDQIERPRFRGLMLQVKKVGEDLYVAIATPPEVDEVWFSPEPLSANKLATQLFNRHCHSIDFADAMNEQDPDWIEKAKGPYE